MSDVEDGELLSDDESNCFDEENDDLKVNFNDNKKLILKENQWNDEEDNVTTQFSNGNYDFGSDCRNNYNSDERNSDDDSEALYKHSEYIANSRKRNSDHFTIDNSPQSHSSEKSDLLPPKRRVLCKYYAAGDCENGETCNFMHGEFPCKFFHDGTAICRADTNCKFSHEPLTEEMKKILDDFIQEGKEKLIHSAISTIKNASFINSFSTQPKSRPKCLLPTPAQSTTHSSMSYDPDFSNSYREISNYPSTKRLASSNIFDIVPNYQIANKLQLIQNYCKRGQINVQRHGQNFLSKKSNQKLPRAALLQTPYPLTGLQRAIRATKTYVPNDNDINSCTNDSGVFMASNNEYVVPDINSKNANYLNSKIHAPARFITNGDQETKSFPDEEVSENLQHDYSDELKKLADQVVIDARLLAPNFDEPIYRQVSTSSMSSSMDNSDRLKDLMMLENSGVGFDNNISIFKDDDEMSEYKKMYIKNTRGIDRQIEATNNWSIKRLDPSNKPPYLLYVLKINEIHNNPLADPRLIGHPVLNNYVKKDVMSEMHKVNEYSQILLLPEDEFDNDLSEISL